MTPALPVTSVISAYAGAKARQYKRDAAFAGFIGLMALLTCFTLVFAFAAFIAQTHGIVIGLLSAAGLTAALAILALIVRSLLRVREKRRQRLIKANAASTLAASSVAGLIAQNKTMAIVGGLALGLLAGSVFGPSRD